MHVSRGNSVSRTFAADSLLIGPNENLIHRIHGVRSHCWNQKSCMHRSLALSMMSSFREKWTQTTDSIMMSRCRVRMCRSRLNFGALDDDQRPWLPSISRRSSRRTSTRNKSFHGDSTSRWNCRAGQRRRVPQVLAPPTSPAQIDRGDRPLTIE